MPTTINGANGIDKVVPNTEVQQIGVNQTWQDVTASRAHSTDYTNTTGKPIVVSILSTNGSSSASSFFYATVDGVGITRSSGGISIPTSMNFIVPNGSTYRCVINSGTPVINIWSELR